MYEIKVTGFHQYVPSESYTKYNDLINAHKEIEFSAENMFMKWIQKEVKIPMFHGDEANEGAILALNFSFKKIYTEVSKVKEKLKFTDAKFLLDYPCGVLICGSTEKTKVACAQVLYPSDSDKFRCTYTMQFHPELAENEVSEMSISEPDYANISTRATEIGKSTPMEDMMWEIMHSPFVRKNTKKSVSKKQEKGCFPCTFN